MQPERHTPPISWSGLSGKILSGGYELKELLSADRESAQFRARVLGDRTLDAIARFIHVSPEEIERQVVVWELMRELRHPNLTRPLGAGSWERDGNQFGYIVQRRADESLQRVVDDRALTAPETTDVLLNITKALETLHLHGVVHGCVSPEQIVAVGNAIQLSVTGVRQAGKAPEIALAKPKYLAPESKGVDGEASENITPEADIWCLGATIFESLTRKEWSEESREETGALPEPFATIALRCLETEPEKRCRLSEAIALLKGDIKPAPRAKAAAAAVGSSSLPAGAKMSATGSAAVVSATPLTVPVAALAAEGVSSAIEQGAGAGADTAVKTPEQSETVPVTANLAASPAPATPKSQPDSKTAAAVTLPPPTPGSQRGSPSIADPRQSARGTAAFSAPGNAGAQPQNSRSQASAGNGRPAAAAGRRPGAGKAANRISSVPPKQRVAPAKTVAPAISKRWILAGIAFLFVVVLVWALRPSTQKPVAVVQPTKTVAASKPFANTPQAAQKNTDVAKLPSSETKVLQPDGTAAQPDNTYPEMPAAKRTLPQSSAPQSSPQGSIAGETAIPAPGTSTQADIWHVILYTYSRSADAERMADTINKRHPDLHAEVFSPKMDQGPYLVTAGGALPKEEAAQMRRKAVGEGMPRDTYTQRFRR